jgi:uncharacterized membrane protein
MASDAGAPQPKKRGSRAWLVVLWAVLLVSLLGNAFVAGIFIRHGGHFAMRARIDDLGLGPRMLWGELDPQTRRMVIRELRKHRGDIEGRMSDIVQARRDVLAAMKADPFDAKAYRAALERSAAIDTQSRQDAINLFVTIVSQLSPEQRKAVADRMERRVDAFRHHRWHRRPRAGGPLGPPPGPPPPGGPDGPYGPSPPDPSGP